MLRSIEMTPLEKPSFGKCIFCGATEDLTDEHIVPEALTGIGQMVIKDGSCRRCNNFANEAYEGKAINNNLLVARHVLGLRRKRRGKHTKPRTMPLVSYTADADDTGSAEFTEALPPENYPAVLNFIVHEPPGRLTGIDRSNGWNTGFRMGVLNLDLPGRIEPAHVSVRHKYYADATELLVAKMAYCWAVAEKGLSAFDTTDLLDLLFDRRKDTLNFVGSPVAQENLAMLRLHKFYFRQRGNMHTVLVHLFASFDGPVYEVVIGEARRERHS